MEKKVNEISYEPKKKLSFWRLFLGLLMLAGISYISVLGWRSFKETLATSNLKPWFAPYVDVTATPHYPFEQSENAKAHKNLVLSFIVSDKNDACIPTWGGEYTFDEASAELDLDRRIARFRQQDGNIAISFGGLLNDELSLKCTDEDKLLNAYKSVIARYTIDTIDLDLEGSELSNEESLKRRAKVMSQLQKDLRADNKNLAVWLTLPVAPSGLTNEGANAVSKMLEAGVDLSGVNVMTMDYGESRGPNQSMEEASKRALIETHRQLGIVYKQNGINLSDTSLWKKIGATPMIGQNDIPGEIFTLDNAKGFNKFAVSKEIARMSFWSANRDIECGENYVNTTVVSDSCSGVKQERFLFSNILSASFEGSITDNSSATTKEDPSSEPIADKPEESPYQIWHENGTYLEGTKVVWRKNVYEAKWWTKGDLPDNPVLQSWETPWQLIGPVLPGEKPIKQPTLPPGTYPEWAGLDVYEAGQRVLFEGVPYQAKWWTQGNSPAASTSNPDSSPWVPLTQEEIEQILENSEKGL